MSSIDTSGARFHGLRDDEVKILYLVARWFNSKPYHIGEQKLHISQDQELPLRDMFDGWNSREYSDYEDAHARVLARDLVDEAVAVLVKELL